MGKALCSHVGCTNFVQRGGVCWRHGAKTISQSTERSKKLKRTSKRGRGVEDEENVVEENEMGVCSPPNPGDHPMFRRSQHQAPSTGGNKVSSPAQNEVEEEEEYTDDKDDKDDDEKKEWGEVDEELEPKRKRGRGGTEGKDENEDEVEEKLNEVEEGKEKEEGTGCGRTRGVGGSEGENENKNVVEEKDEVEDGVEESEEDEDVATLAGEGAAKVGGHEWDKETTISLAVEQKTSTVEGCAHHICVASIVSNLGSCHILQRASSNDICAHSLLIIIHQRYVRRAK